MSAVTRILLGEVVDYAGLFPPASLDMAAAVAEYARYRDDPASWMLGRFVLPLNRLVEWEKAAAPALATIGDDDPWRLSVLGDAHQSAPVSRRIRDFNSRFLGRAYIDSAELKASGPDEVAYAGTLGEDGVAAYVEVPIAQDPLPWIEALVRAGARAKVRTGGVTSDAFPSAKQLARFIKRCVERRVAFKATAGLHHPLRAEYRLTYDDGAERATMFGFLNVFLAAALARAGGSEADLVPMLEERDPASVHLGEDVVEWRGKVIDAETLRLTRSRVAVSFGSCSFREPVDELAALRLQ
jgi:hypothetical protein